MSENTGDYSIGAVGGLSNPLFVPEDLEEPLLEIIRETIFKPFIEQRRFKLRAFNHANYQYVVLLPEAMIRFLMCRDNISQAEAEAVNIVFISSTLNSRKVLNKCHVFFKWPLICNVCSVFK